MPKCYMVLPISYEYNDEYYHTGYNGDSFEKPNKVYLDKNVAQAELDKLERKAFQGLEVASYCSDGWNSISSMDEEELARELTKILGNKAKTSTIEKKRAQKRKELEMTLSRTLKGKVLAAAVEGAVMEEFPLEDGEEAPKIDLDDFSGLPDKLTDVQIDAIRDCFDQLKFHELVAVELDPTV